MGPVCGAGGEMAEGWVADLFFLPRKTEKT